MRRRFLLVVSSAFVLARCGFLVPAPTHVRFFPIEGPYAEQRPVPVFDASGWVEFATIGLTVQFPDGESMKVDLSDSVQGAAAANDDMAPVWDKVFGPGYYNASVLGTGHLRGSGTGKLGTRLDVESSGWNGVARDTHGNVFKVTFGGMT